MFSHFVLLFSCVIRNSIRSCFACGSIVVVLYVVSVCVSCRRVLSMYGPSCLMSVVCVVCVYFLVRICYAHCVRLVVELVLFSFFFFSFFGVVSVGGGCPCYVGSCV